MTKDYCSFHDFHFETKCACVQFELIKIPTKSVANELKKKYTIKIKRNDNLLKCDEVNQIFMARILFYMPNLDSNMENQLNRKNGFVRRNKRRSKKMVQKMVFIR